MKMESEYRFSNRNRPKKTPDSKKSDNPLSFSESDSILILMLVFLLQKEGGDEMLIMALMYILS